MCRQIFLKRRLIVYDPPVNSKRLQTVSTEKPLPHPQLRWNRSASFLIYKGANTMSEVSISALTDVILACELFFLSGFSFQKGVHAFSPAWIWALTLGLIGAASMLGAIDHGFFEAIGHPGHRPMVVITRLVIVAGSLSLIVAAATNYLTGLWRNLVLLMGAGVALWPVFVILTSDGFLPVILYYALGFLFLLALSLAHWRQNKGTTAMIIGIILTLAISAMIPLESNGFWGLGLYGSYHVLLMPTILLLYWGGRFFRSHPAVAQGRRHA
jgi:hypothetical protein